MGQPLYKGQNRWPHSVPCSELPLYSWPQAQGFLFHIPPSLPFHLLRIITQIWTHTKRAQLMETVHMKTEPYAFDYFFEQSQQKRKTSRTGDGDDRDSSSSTGSSDSDTD